MVDDAPAATKTRTARARELRTSLQGYLFIAPAFCILIVFVAGPALWVVGLSTFNWDLIGSGVFIGLRNYVELFADPTWWQAFGQTLYFVVVSVPVGMAIALGLALLLNKPIAGRGIFRGALFAPYVTPAVATLVIWQWIFNRSYGLLNAILRTFHLPPVGWLIDPRAIMPAVIIYTLWSTVGFTMVIFLAGLANVPDELREAAQVDGASRWHVFRHVTWPLLGPTTYFVLVISTISSFKVFNAVYVLAGTSGGPNQAALTIGPYLYEQAFQFFHAGYASAISVALFVIILVFTLIQNRFTGGRVFYG